MYSFCFPLQFFSLEVFFSHLYAEKKDFERGFQHQIECDGSVFCTSKRITSLLQKPSSRCFFSRVFIPRLFLNKKIETSEIFHRLSVFVDNVFLNMHTLRYDSFYKIWRNSVFVAFIDPVKPVNDWRDVLRNESKQTPSTYARGILYRLSEPSGTRTNT